MKNLQHLNRFEIRLSGTGGQGIITLGRVMGQALALEHGYYATQTQSYGPEARGGSSRADLVVSSKPISFPKTESVDLLIALSQEACNKYFRNLKRQGILLIDTELVTQPPTNLHLGLPFSSLAKNKVGNPLTVNTLVLGATTHLLPFAEPRLMRKALKESLPPKIQQINQKAFDLGLREAKKHFGETPEIWRSVEQSAIEEESHEYE